MHRPSLPELESVLTDVLARAVARGHVRILAREPVVYDVACYEAAYSAARWPGVPPVDFPRRILAAEYNWAFRTLGLRAELTAEDGACGDFDELRRVAAAWAAS